jgi:hypothetical protein
VTDLAAPDEGRIEQRLRRDLHAVDELLPNTAVTPDLVADTRRLGAGLLAHRRVTTVLVVVLAVLAVTAVLVSPALGRAQPSSSYRPDLPADPIELGCYPLPRGLTLDFPYQVRTDGDLGGRRLLTLHWDELDAAEVRRRLDAALDRAGLPRDTATVTPFPDLAPDAIVRGTVVLRLPVARLTSDDPQCQDPATTKRFPPDWAPSTTYG